MLVTECHWERRYSIQHSIIGTILLFAQHWFLMGEIHGAVSGHNQRQILNMVVSQTQVQSRNRRVNSSCLAILCNTVDFEEVDGSAEFSTFSMLKLLQVYKPSINHHPPPIMHFSRHSSTALYCTVSVCPLISSEVLSGTNLMFSCQIRCNMG